MNQTPDNDQKKAIVSFPAESLIIKEGEIYTEMYKIISGRAEMYVGYGTDYEVLVSIIGPGACFGEFGLLMNSPSIYTVIAYSDVYALRVTEERLGSFIQDNHASVLQIMKNMAHTMDLMQHQITALSIELSSHTKEHEKKMVDMKKNMLRSFYNPNGMGLKGMTYFLENYESPK